VVVPPGKQTEKLTRRRSTVRQGCPPPPAVEGTAALEDAERLGAEVTVDGVETEEEGEELLYNEGKVSSVDQEKRGKLTWLLR
jgi:hypothetical protein